MRGRGATAYDVCSSYASLRSWPLCFLCDCFFSVPLPPLGRLLQVLSGIDYRIDHGNAVDVLRLAHRSV
jgi:hypothetical protein